MTFATQEESRHHGRPIQLYFFRYGVAIDSYYAYTDSETRIVADHGGAEGPIEYLPIPVSRGSISSSGSLDKTKMELRMPAKFDVADLYREGQPSYVVGLIIRSGHVDLNDYKVAWSGRVLGASFDDDEIVFTCEPISTSMRRTGLRRRYQYGCAHVLYGSYCRADKAAATVTAPVYSFNANRVVLESGWNGVKPMAKFEGGLLEWTTPQGNTELRTIIQVDSGALIVDRIPKGMSEGTVCSISLGCNHMEDDCTSLHVETGTGNPNTPNYGGQPWIPLKNPVNNSNIY